MALLIPVEKLPKINRSGISYKEIIKEFLSQEHSIMLLCFATMSSEKAIYYGLRQYIRRHRLSNVKVSIRGNEVYIRRV